MTSKKPQDQVASPEGAWRAERVAHTYRPTGFLRGRIGRDLRVDTGRQERCQGGRCDCGRTRVRWNAPRSAETVR